MAQSKEFNELAIAVFSGNANLPLAHEITRHLHVPLGRAQVGRFSDGEVNIELMENVRAMCDVPAVQVAAWNTQGKQVLTGARLADVANVLLGGTLVGGAAAFASYSIS